MTTLKLAANYVDGADIVPTYGQSGHLQIVFENELGSLEEAEVQVGLPPKKWSSLK